MTAARIILVHGGWSDASVWRPVADVLLEKGLDVIAAQLKLESLDEDAAIVKGLLERDPRPTILVGHSYGGVVITEAGAQQPSVKALVYVAAAAPDVGEMLGELMGRHAGSYPVALAPDASGRLWASRELFAEGLAHDLSVLEAEWLTAAQKPVSASLFGSSCSHAAWREVPCWQLVADDDRLVSREGQEEMAARASAKVVHVASGHMVPLTSPAVVVEMILDAAGR